MPQPKDKDWLNGYKNKTPIHAASLCLLIEAFNPLTFNVIIDKYGPIALYFVDLGLSL